MKKEIVNCERARTISIPEGLEKLGHLPTRETEKEAWYLSPLRSETQASFKVNLKLNRWYDFGLGKGGNLIDLLIIYLHTDVNGVLLYLQNVKGTLCQPQRSVFQNHQKPAPSPFTITRIKSVSHPALLSYAQRRGISGTLLKAYAYEVHFRLKNSNQFALGFKNEKGGYELRSKFLKLSTSPKASSWVLHGNQQLIICEGWFDFLSLAAFQKDKIKQSDVLILNSTALVEKIAPKLKDYQELHLYLDRDSAGNKALGFIKSLHSNTIDCSSLYRDHNDLNDWWQKSFI
mgnify:CR=1 FL=1